MHRKNNKNWNGTCMHIAEATHFSVLTCNSGNHLRQPCNYNTVISPEGVEWSLSLSNHTGRMILSLAKNVLNTQTSSNFKGSVQIDFSLCCLFPLPNMEIKCFGGGILHVMGEPSGCSIWNSTKKSGFSQLTSIEDTPYWALTCIHSRQRRSMDE